MNSNNTEAKHWFIRWLPLIVAAAMVIIPASSAWMHGLYLDSVEAQAKKEKAQELFISGKAIDADVQLETLIQDVSRGDWTRVPSEWRDAAREILGQERVGHIRQALQESPPSENEIKILLDQILKD